MANTIPGGLINRVLQANKYKCHSVPPSSFSKTWLERVPATPPNLLVETLTSLLATVEMLRMVIWGPQSVDVLQKRSQPHRQRNENLPSPEAAASAAGGGQGSGIQAATGARPQAARPRSRGHSSLRSWTQKGSFCCLVLVSSRKCRENSLSPGWNPPTQPRREHGEATHPTPTGTQRSHPEEIRSDGASHCQSGRAELGLGSGPSGQPRGLPHALGCVRGLGISALGLTCLHVKYRQLEHVTAASALQPRLLIPLGQTGMEATA